MTQLVELNSRLAESSCSYRLPAQYYLLPRSDPRIPVFWIFARGRLCFLEEISRIWWAGRARDKPMQRKAAHKPALRNGGFMLRNKLHANILKDIAPGAQSGTSGWRVGMLIVSSALLSGIAVVLWNRRALQNMRQAQPGQAGPWAEDAHARTQGDQWTEAQAEARGAAAYGQEFI